MIELAQPPLDIALVDYRNDTYTFSFPEGGRLLHLDSELPPTRLRLLFELSGKDRIRINIEPSAEFHSAEAAAITTYERATTFADHRYTVAPFPLQNVNGWRFRRRFIDGTRASLVTDQAFLQSLAGIVYQVKFTAQPSIYEKGRWVFETVIRSLAIVANG